MGLCSLNMGRSKSTNTASLAIVPSAVEMLWGIFKPAIVGPALPVEQFLSASLAMEAAPQRWRGILSGVLQSGYSVGYLLAAIAARFVLPTLGWRWMFWLGGVPALLALYIRSSVPESEAWKQHRAPSTGALSSEGAACAPRDGPTVAYCLPALPITDAVREQVQFPGAMDRGSPARYLEFPVEGFDVCLDRVDGDVHFLSDLSVTGHRR